TPTAPPLTAEVIHTSATSSESEADGIVQGPIWNTPAPTATATVEAAALPPHLIFTGGLDYTPIYYRRGYLQDDSGLIVQPFVSGGGILNPGESVLVQPYVTAWGSFGVADLDKPMAHMAEGMTGVFLTWGGLNVDGS